MFQEKLDQLQGSSPLARQNNKSIASLKVDLVIEIGKLLHEFGASSTRLEGVLKSFSKDIGLTEPSIFSTPTAIMASFMSEDKRHNRLLRLEPGHVNLKKLGEVDSLANDFTAGNITMEECFTKAKALQAAPSGYPTLLQMSCYGLSAGAISLILGGAQIDLLCSITIGLLIGIYSVGKRKFLGNRNTSELICAIMATIVALIWANFAAQINIPLVIMAGLIVLIPGLNLTMALSEMASNDLASGTARLTGAIMSLLKLSLGVAIASRLAPLLDLHIRELPANEYSNWFKLFLIPVASLSFTVLFKARFKDYPWLVIAGMAGFTSSKLGHYLLGEQLGVFFGGLVLGAGSNAFARLTKRPALTVLLPGIILLVPGSIGYKSFVFMFEHNVLQSLDQAFNTLIMAIGLVGGVLVGNMLINPRKDL